jgi:A/G-specific adenine glycosylase
VARRAAFQAALLRWYRAERRRLPWREEPSLYRTVVSEFMLQQTQVKTMLPYFARWMAELPDFAALAAAAPERVLKLWEGLGYYSRAGNLHRLAQTLAALPEVPRSPAAWLELPGVGPYTAAAVTSIAFGTPQACVDGNIVRILARLTAEGTRYRDGATAAKAFAPLAQELMPVSAAGDHNQAMMELGATVCLRQNPLCPDCPVRAFCAGAREGSPVSFPRFVPRAVEKRAVVRIWCESRGRLLLHRAAADARRLAGLYELPTAEQAGLARSALGPVLATKRRVITRYQITESIRRAPAPRGRLGAGLEWVALARVPRVTLSGPHRRWVAEILAAQRGG